MNIQQAIALLVDGYDLQQGQMQAVMRAIMSGEATEAQIAGFLIALRMKGETVTEIAAAAAVMRDFATPVSVADTNLVDIVGTGGDGSQSFNISTTAAFVIAAAGGRIAKHNNRAVSSRSGSADVLQQAGVNIDLPPEGIARCIVELGIGFIFAPKHHPAMRHAAGPRAELAIRTIFNVLGPLTNPARVKRQLVGVYSEELVRPLAEVLQQLGSCHAMVVCAADGMDEISVCATTRVAELKDDTISEYALDPARFGFGLTDRKIIRQALIVDGAEHSHSVMQAVLNNDPGPCRDIVVLNAAAAIYLAGLCDDLNAGVVLADEVLASGAAKARLQQLVTLSNTLALE